MKASCLICSTVLFIICNILTGVVHSVSFSLKAGSKKCFLDGAKKDIPVKGEYSVSKNERYRVHLTVKDARPDKLDDLLYNKESAVQGKFAFSFDYDAVMEICFKNEAPEGSGVDRIITFNVLLGFDAKNYKDLPASQKLAPHEATMLMLSDMSQYLVRSFGWLIVKGDEMHITNESTTSRILYLGVFVTILFVILTTGQLFYLHRYFSAKKLI
ncbi:hypothetical protein QZH41_014838 [Actinostola sp. cb2023]|nr:hypothetical protein QZH41_014838 [Actinostola sp. cb2023]